MMMMHCSSIYPSLIPNGPFVPFRFFRTKFLLPVLLLVALASCAEDEEAPPAYEPDYLVEAVSVMDLDRSDVVALLGDEGVFPSEFELLVRYGVEAVRLTYNTVSWDGEPVVASGALIIPKTAEPLPLLAFQHGTITDPLEAPSLFQSEYMELSSVFASTGFIMALPDYLGYGESGQIEHPYEHRATLATATRDMIRASYEYFLVKNLDGPSGELFLSGYSAGGFATMATLKLLQEDHTQEFHVTAATVGAGAYNKTATMAHILSAEEDMQHINSYLWVLDVYNDIYPQLGRPYSDYFNEPWATMIEQEGVFASVEKNPSLLFKSAFIEGVLSGSDTGFLSALSDNDVYNWKPDMPLRLYHGTDDQFVPYLNTLSAYDAMLDLGAESIELVYKQGGTHDSSVLNYLTGTFGFFSSFRY